MKIQVTTPIQGYDGKVIKTSDDGKNERDFLVRDAIIASLNTSLQDEVMLAEQKARVFHITNKIYAKSEVDLTVDELAFVKERAGKVLTPIAYGRLCEVIDPKAATKDAEA